MMNTEPGDPLDQWMRESLQERPLPRAPRALAARAMARAMDHDAVGVLDHLASRWRWGLRVNLLAGVVVICLVAAIIPNLLQSSDTSTSNAYSLQTEQSYSEGSTAESPGLPFSDTFLLGGAVMLGVVVLLTVERAFDGESHSSPGLLVPANTSV